MKELNEFNVVNEENNESMKYPKGSQENPFSVEEFETLANANDWNGGFVDRVGYLKKIELLNRLANEDVYYNDNVFSRNVTFSKSILTDDAYYFISGWVFWNLDKENKPIPSSLLGHYSVHAQSLTSSILDEKSGLVTCSISGNYLRCNFTAKLLNPENPSYRYVDIEVNFKFDSSNSNIHHITNLEVTFSPTNH